MNDLPGITHNFGAWTPMRFIPVPFREDKAPAFWVSTTRACRGLHDLKCREQQTQVFGPLVLEGATAADIALCGNCGRTQPPSDTGHADREQATRSVCLFCTDSATVQTLGDSRAATEALTSVAALFSAASMLRQVATIDDTGATALLEATGDTVRTLLEQTAYAVKEDPARAAHNGSRIMVQLARTINANARDYAQLHIEHFPVKEME